MTQKPDVYYRFTKLRKFLVESLFPEIPIRYSKFTATENLFGTRSPNIIRRARLFDDLSIKDDAHLPAQPTYKSESRFADALPRIYIVDNALPSSIGGGSKYLPKGGSTKA